MKEKELCPLGYYLEYVGPIHGHYGKLQPLAGKTVRFIENTFS